MTSPILLSNKTNENTNTLRNSKIVFFQKSFMVDLLGFDPKLLKYSFKTFQVFGNIFNHFHPRNKLQ